MPEGRSYTGTGPVRSTGTTSGYNRQRTEAQIAATNRQRERLGGSTPLSNTQRRQLAARRQQALARRALRDRQRQWIDKKQLGTRFGGGIGNQTPTGDRGPATPTPIGPPAGAPDRPTESFQGRIGDITPEMWERIKADRIANPSPPPRTDSYGMPIMDPPSWLTDPNQGSPEDIARRQLENDWIEKNPPTMIPPTNEDQLNASLANRPKHGNPRLSMELDQLSRGGSGEGLVGRDGRVVVTLVPAPGQLSEGIDAAAIQALGGEVLRGSRHLLAVSLPPEALERATQIPGVNYIRRPVTPQPQEPVGAAGDARQRRNREMDDRQRRQLQQRRNRALRNRAQRGR